jgi:hypothetical protein
MGIMLAGHGPASGSPTASRGWLTALRTADGSVDTGFARPSFTSDFSEIRDVEPDGRGGWFLAGSFPSIGGVACRNLAHVDASGKVDRRWCPRPDGDRVSLMARTGDTLYVTGDFTRIGGADRHWAAAISVRTGRATSWQAGEAFAGRPFGLQAIDALAAGAGRVFLGNSRRFLGGSGPIMAALDARTGRALAWNPRLDAKGCSGCDLQVCAIAVAGRSVYVAGDFTHAGGLRRVGLASLDAVTARPTAWQANTDELAVQGGDPCSELSWGLATSGRTVYASGGFSRINGVPRYGIAAIDGNAGRLRSWVPTLPGSFGSVSAFAVDSSSAVIAYDFGVDSIRFGVRVVDTSTGRSVRWSHEQPCCIWIAGIDGGRVLLGGRR